MGKTEKKNIDLKGSGEIRLGWLRWWWIA